MPRYIAKKDLPMHAAAEQLGVPVRKGNRNSHNVTVGENPGDTCELSSWIFANIPFVVVRLLNEFLKQQLVCFFLVSQYLL